VKLEGEGREGRKGKAEKGRLEGRGVAVGKGREGKGVI